MSNFRSHRAYYDSLKDDSDNEQRRSPGNSNRRWQHDRFQHGPARPPPELIDLDADDDVEDERTRRRRVEADEPVVAASGPNEDACARLRALHPGGPKWSSMSWETCVAKAKTKVCAGTMDPNAPRVAALSSSASIPHDLCISAWAPIDANSPSLILALGDSAVSSGGVDILFQSLLNTNDSAVELGYGGEPQTFPSRKRTFDDYGAPDDIVTKRPTPSTAVLEESREINMNTDLAYAVSLSIDQHKAEEEARVQADAEAMETALKVSEKEKIRKLEKYKSSLPVEPAEGVAVQCFLPNGTKLLRKFKPIDSTEMLYRWVQSYELEHPEIIMDSLVVTKAYPRAAIERSRSITIESIGLTGRVRVNVEL